MPRRSYWVLVFALAATMINAAPTFASTGVIWGS